MKRLANYRVEVQIARVELFRVPTTKMIRKALLQYDKYVSIILHEVKAYRSCDLLYSCNELQ